MNERPANDASWRPEHILRLLVHAVHDRRELGLETDRWHSLPRAGYTSPNAEHPLFSAWALLLHRHHKCQRLRRFESFCSALWFTADLQRASHYMSHLRP